MKKYLILAALVNLGLAINAHAFVSVNATILGLNDLANTPATGRTIAVIDTDNDGLLGFGDLNANDGSSFLFDADDVIVTENGAYGTDGVWDDVVNGGLLVSSTYAFDLGGSINTGDKVFLFWFPGLDALAPAPGLGQAFGVIELGTLPNDGFGLNALSTAQAYAAQYQTLVPEPASMALLGLGGLLIAARRK